MVKIAYSIYSYPVSKTGITKTIQVVLYQINLIIDN